MPRFISVWNDDRTARLIALRAENLSFGKIAARLTEEAGTTISRDAVLGRTRRLYLANRLTRRERRLPPSRPPLSHVLPTCRRTSRWSWEVIACRSHSNPSPVA